MQGIIGYGIDCVTGKARACEKSMCSLVYYHAYPGDMLVIRTKGGNTNFGAGSICLKLALYRLEIDSRYIYTYAYQEEENWATFWKVEVPDGEEYMFKEECYFRLSVTLPHEKDMSAKAIWDSVIWVHKEKTMTLPPVFAEAQEDVVRQAKDKKNEETLQFLLLSDSHYTVNGTWDFTVNNLCHVAEELCLDGIVHLGDLTDGLVPKDVTAVYVQKMLDDMRGSGLPLYYVMGNHDSNYFRKNPQPFLREEMETLYFGKEPAGTVRGARQFYYYRDFEKQNMRCIFLDSFDCNREWRYGFSEEELDWLEEVLCTTPESYYVTVFSHVPPVPRLHYWSKDICGSVRLTAILRRYQRTSRGRILGFVHGHNHADQTDWEEGFPIVSIGCSKCEYFEDKKPAGAATPERKLGELSQELWDVLTISGKERSLDFIRFGAGENRHIENTGVEVPMKKVITYGTFDLFHEGHYNLLKRAKELGEYLIVGITTEHYDEQRGKLNVVDSLIERIENVKRTGLADEIIIEDHEGQKIEDIQKYKVDIFAIGSDWIGFFDYLKAFCQVVYLERTPNISSTMLRKQKFAITQIGIVGTGRIAPRFIAEAKYVSGISVRSAYNPHKESAKQFEKKCQIECYSGSFEKFLSMVDAIYIASPHETHYGYAKRALLAGKHILCEKPLVFSRRQAEELFQLAEQKNLVLMEGIKTAYCPGFVQLLNVAKSGKIGRICDVEACFSRLTASNLREMTDRAYGGAFMEFGSYTLLPILKLLGLDYKKIQISSILAENGVDLYTKIQMEYRDGFATSKTGIGVKSEGQLLIAGTKGYILAEAPWWLTKKFEVHYEDPDKIEQFTPTFMGDGLRYEISNFISRINGCSGHDFKLTRAESLVMADIVESFMEQREALRQEERQKNRESEIKIWAHRGCSYKYPENTLAAFEAACQIEHITGIELDVQRTKDGKLAVFHDDTLERLMGIEGNIEDYTMEQLKGFPFKDWKCGEQKGYADIRIPTLEEVLCLIKPFSQEKGILVNIELKNNKNLYEGMEKQLIEVVRKHGMKQFVVYSSFNKESLKELRRQEPDCKIAVLGSDIQDCIEADKEIKGDAIHPGIASIKGKISLPEHVPVRAWNVEEPFYGQSRPYIVYKLPELAEKGVTDLITNVPEEYL